MADRTCEGCGTELPPRKRGMPRKWCSERCRVATWRDRDPERARKLNTDNARRRAAEQRATRAVPIDYRTCVMCGAGFVVNLASAGRYRTVCSKPCRNRRNYATPAGQKVRRAAKDRRRARQRDAYIEDVDRQAIYERDGWRCRLCGKRVPRDLVVPDELAATLDHIIPLSAGGTHEPRNCQLAHFRCNVAKGNRAASDQLRLIG